MQQAEVYQTKISTLVPEGTVVKEGDVVAELDRSGIAAKVAEISLALQKAEAQLTPGTARLHAQPRHRARGDQDAGALARGKAPREGAGGVRVAERQASGRDRLREGDTAARPVQGELHHEDAAGGRQDGGSRRRRSAPAEQAQDRAGSVRQLHDPRAVAGHGHLREGVERQEERHRLPGQRLGSHRRDAARPRPDGVADVRERDRRPQDRVGAEGDDLARLRSDEEAARQRDGRRERRRAAA